MYFVSQYELLWYFKYLEKIKNNQIKFLSIQIEVEKIGFEELKETQLLTFILKALKN